MYRESGTDGPVWGFVQDVRVCNRRPWVDRKRFHVFLGVRQYFEDSLCN